MGTTLLLVLQLIGLALAAGAMVANILKSKGIEEIRTSSLIIGGPEMVTRRLTREARIGVYLIGAGLFVSFAAKVIEQYLTNQRSLQSQQQTATQLDRAEEQLMLARRSISKLEEQGALARKELAYIKRIVGELDDLTIEASYELCFTNAATKALASRMRSYAAPVIAQGLPVPLSDPSQTTTNTDDGDDEQTNVYSLNTVGMLNDPKLGLIVHSFVPSTGDIEFNFGEVFSETWLSELGSTAELQNLVKYLQAPTLEVRIFSRRTNTRILSKADLFCPRTKAKSEPTVIVNHTSNRLALRWTFECPRDRWRQTIRMSSISDIDEAILSLNLCSEPAALERGLRPLAATLSFGRTSVVATDFELSQLKQARFDRRYEVAFTATLPPPDSQPLDAETGSMDGSTPPSVFSPPSSQAVAPTGHALPPSPPTGLRIVIAD
jgi:hypothetical protein